MSPLVRGSREILRTSSPDFPTRGIRSRHWIRFIVREIEILMFCNLPSLVVILESGFHPDFSEENSSLLSLLSFCHRHRKKLIPNTRGVHPRREKQRTAPASCPLSSYSTRISPNPSASSKTIFSIFPSSLITSSIIPSTSSKNGIS